MMSCFFNVLRFIFCNKNEEESLLQCDYAQIPNDDSVSEFISPVTFNPSSSNQCTMKTSPSSSSLANTFQDHKTDNFGEALESVTVKAKKKKRRTKKKCKDILSHNVTSSPQTSEHRGKNQICVEEDTPENSKSLIEKDTFGDSSSCVSEYPPSSLYLFLISAAIYAKLSSLSKLRKHTISLSSSNLLSLEKNVNHNWVKKGAPLPRTYLCPNGFKCLIEKDIVPEVLQKPLSSSTYKEYFQALLYAEEIYFEKWDGFEMKNVTLQLHDAKTDMCQGQSKTLNDEKTFVEFELDKIPERCPFLLSSDFVTVRPLTNNNKTFQGIIYHVVTGNLVLAEFDEDFHSQHKPFVSYDVKFSFNRVCLKRAHQAISDASQNLFKNFLFPKFILGNTVSPNVPCVAHKVALKDILTLQGSPPYILEGPLSGDKSDQLQIFVVKTIFQIYRASSLNKILLCAPTYNICDKLMRILGKEIPESDMFRTNASFQEFDQVPDSTILPTCLCETEQECFSCPSLKELSEFKVILSTYMNSFRLHKQGIMAGHFTHILLVDASSITEPETLVPLANFAIEKTSVVVIGALGNCSSWIRSTMAKENGLSISYFERLFKRRLLEGSVPEVPSAILVAQHSVDVKL